MLKKLVEYKGVILFIAVLVVMTNMLSINVKHINETQDCSTTINYEK